MRLVADVRRALQKKPELRRWAMVIDVRRCIGCNACTVACIAENNLPPGVLYRTVHEAEEGDFPNLVRTFMPTNCMQCDKPPCVEAANAVLPGSMRKRPDGVVEVDYERMRGREVFEAARAACPYTALYYDEGKNYTDGTPALQPYEKRAVREYGKPWSRQQTAGTTRKCHFCLDRVEQGRLPACVATCTGLAMYFGDLSDETSLVSELVASGRARRLSPELGTEPRVFYVGDWPETKQPVSSRPAFDCTSCHSFGS